MCKMWRKKIDHNGEIIEQFMDDRCLVRLNTGEGTRLNITENTVSSSESTVGSDHFPIVCRINVNSSNTE